MAITRAEFDAAMNAAVERMKRMVDFKIDTRINDIRNEIGIGAQAQEERLSALHDDVFEAMSTDMADVVKQCRRNREDLRELREKLIELEKAFDRFRSRYATEELEDHDIRGL